MIQGLFVLEDVGQPFQTFVQTVTRGGASSLVEPVSVTDGVQAKSFSDLGDCYIKLINNCAQRIKHVL